ncbi:glucosamine-6-phosphate deaminase [Robertkochia sediminum]|uniref:glucosamine-6-phosphate deaminase n=1 Tax=Robertkochia sediminum TaxID=2785326 RepID=UPI00193281E6|nr:glucosamine-6-phosphate deaminase [Robertkochia sediminum]MBL7472394.1 glucosamine-6-phosphate deaminase [Robertkochia sediminum]
MIAEEQLRNLTDISYQEAGIYENTRFEKIHNVVYDDAYHASAIVAREIADLIRQKEKEGKPCVLGLATGSSPIRVYSELVRLHKEEGLSFKNVITFNLDEYYPMTKQNVQSYHYFMHEYLFKHIDIPAENINIPNGELHPDEVLDFCVAYENKIKACGGLDFQLLGIGRTGHIGFNEPGSHFNSRTRMVTLDHLTRSDAAPAFLGIENVPKKAITMGIRTVLEARRVVLLAWGQNKAEIIQKAVEGPVTPQVPSTYLQEHHNTTFVMDVGAASELTRIKTPWLVGPCEWNTALTRKAVVWLCDKTGKSILRLTDKDYNDHGMEGLLTKEGSSYDLNIKMFNVLQHTITGWPGGKPNADDAKRPERSAPAKKRVIIFSPHPDDDVISMGGTFDRLVEQGHEVHIVYQTSGNIAVSNHEAIKFAEVSASLTPDASVFTDLIENMRSAADGGIDSPEVLKLKGLIREKESLGATRYMGLPDEQVHFLKLPFYETGAIKKKPLGKEDIDLMCEVIDKVKPHQIYAAGDLADPHGTHKVCLDALLESLKVLKEKPYMSDCWVWLYRGAWHEWDMHEIEMAVPMSPDQVLKKRHSIFFHQSQKDGVMFQGDDSREFWVRAEERNKETAANYHKLGLADYAAMEAFKRYYF